MSFEWLVCSFIAATLDRCIVLFSHNLPPGPPLWFGHPYRIIILQNSMEIAQASSAAIINSDWDEVNALYDRESVKYVNRRR